MSATTQTASAASVPKVASHDIMRWPGYLLALAVTSVVIGILWDISWHMTIGRDTFWTPAHIAVYFGGTLAGCVGGWLAVKHTFFPTPEERAVSVSVFGARAPLGAWVTIWGALAMLTSGPFDDWWHNAYGLDVKIISPPHTILGLGMMGISVGALLLTLARQNREANGAGGWLFVYVGGIFVALGAVFISEYTFPNLQHGTRFYGACCTMFPFRLVTVGRAGRLSWTTTRVAAVYMLAICSLVWILPLFPGTPKLAPIYNPLTHMVPPVFPVLVIIPALGIDLMLRTIGESGATFEKRMLALAYSVPRALALGAIFLVLLIAVQWFFSDFMLSPHAENWFFAGNRHWGYGNGRGSWRHEFWFDNDSLTVRGVMLCWAIASISSWLGLLWGSWMRKVKR